MLKTCTNCDIEKPLDDFYSGTNNRGGKRPTCKACTNADNRRRWKLKSKEWAPTVRNRALKRHYGIDQVTYERLLAKQGGKCAICGTDKPARCNKYFSVDHCHVTGKVRGLLCANCNTALGHIERTGLARGILARMSAYLDCAMDLRELHL